ncbi:nucleotide-binding universal stress UspA family protein [Streptomyces achromogenes]|uniref:universal stress protein n=1 Tax=Streptomyces achromogenes TaxID=67255 RepID=UPI00277DA409|nr:universal stress protein [Streptomyces achromogenes]MDQ0834465.1 nucleotide-binding universal stress UspA family protein [Streptomyces achromogenes]
MERDSGPRVVVGVDGSQSSYAALRWAVRYGALIGAGVVAVAAWELPGGRVWPARAIDATFDEQRAREGLVQELRDVLGAEYADTVRAYLVQGNAVDVLLGAGEGAEAMVVGSRGRGGFARALLGSVSQHVAQHAKCPVVIVRPDAS